MFARPERTAMKVRPVDASTSTRTSAAPFRTIAAAGVSISALPPLPPRVRTWARPWSIDTCSMRSLMSSTSSDVPPSMRSAVEPSRSSARPPASAHRRSPTVSGRLTKASPHSSGRPAGASDTAPVT